MGVFFIGCVCIMVTAAVIYFGIKDIDAYGKYLSSHEYEPDEDVLGVEDN